MRDRWYKPPFCWVIRRDPLTMRAGNMLQLPVKQTKLVPTSALYVDSFLGVRTPYKQQWTEDPEPLLLVISTVMIFAIPCVGNPYLGLVAGSSCSSTSLSEDERPSGEREF